MWNYFRSHEILGRMVKIPGRVQKSVEEQTLTGGLEPPPTRIPRRGVSDVKNPEPGGEPERDSPTPLLTDINRPPTLSPELTPDRLDLSSDRPRDTREDRR